LDLAHTPKEETVKTPDGWTEIPGDRAPEILSPLLTVLAARPDAAQIATVTPGNQVELDEAIDSLPSAGSFAPLGEMSPEASALLKEHIVTLLGKAASQMIERRPFMTVAPGATSDLHLLAMLLVGEIRTPRSFH